MSVKKRAEKRSEFLIDRRSFIAASLGTASNFFLPSFLTRAANAATTSSSSGTQPTFVYVFLRGAMDGLSLLPPSSKNPNYSIYSAARPNTNLFNQDPSVYATPFLLSNAPYGLHPSAANIHYLYENGSLAFVPGAGSINESRSHFIQQKLIEAGTPDLGNPGPTGFLNRALANVSEKSADMPAASMNPGLTYSLRGSQLAQVVPSLSTNISSSDIKSNTDAAVRIAGGWTLKNGLGRPLDNQLNNMGFQALRGLSVVQKAATLSTTDLMPLSATSLGSSTPPLHYGGQSGFRNAVQLLRSEPGIRIMTIDVQNWDHHFNVMPRFVSTLTPLDQALGAFVRDLGGPVDPSLGVSKLESGPNLWNNVCIVVMSEFGRRVQQNISFGFDHGRGGVMMVLGGAVNGKRVVADPSYGLSTLDQGDVMVTTDYRDVVCEVFQKISGIANPQTIFDTGYTFNSKKILKS